MSINFPTSLDTLTTGIGASGQPLSSPNHITQHTNESLAIQALETKVGIDSSAVTGSIDYKIRHIPTSSITTDDAGVFTPSGAVVPYAGASAPTGYLICDGSAVSRSTYSTLFGILSTTYGSGNGSTTFNVPDLRGRFPLGVGTGAKVLTFSSRSSNTITITGAANSANNENQTGQAVLYHSTSTIITGLTNDTTYYVIRIAYNQFQLATSLANAISSTAISLSSDGAGTQTFTYALTARALADTGGEETHGLIVNELPQTTASGGPFLKTGSSSNGFQSGASLVSTTANATFGGSLAHNTMAPFLSLNYIIKT